MDAKQIRAGVWEITGEGGRVPVRVYATEKLFRKMEEGVFKQAVNVSKLPGIQKASLIMPDGHYGYGFPIGGVAAFDPEEGIVSPGGVGYDINCLSGDSKILHEHGYTMPIKEFERRFSEEKIKCMNFGVKVKNASIAMYMKSRPRDGVYKIKTLGGREIMATGDHPLYTPQGMVKVRDVKEKVAIYPFKGIPYEKPSRKTIVSDVDVKNKFRDRNVRQSVNELKKRDLLPLTYDNEKLPYLLKMMGFICGDGVLYFTKGKGTIWFYGKPEDLEEIREDIKELGYTPSRIYSREREHHISTEYRDYEFSRIEYSFKTTSTSLAVLLSTLGVPVGSKAEQDYLIPEWLFHCKLWQKRLFLASLFGAELSAPSTVTRHEHNFYCPILSMNKKIGYVDSGKGFLEQIRRLLTEFGVYSSIINERKEKTSIRLRLQISSEPTNLIKLWSKIGFEYNKKRKYLGNVVTQYLILKEKVMEERIESEEKAKEMKARGFPASEIYKQLKSKNVNKRFIERSLYGGRKTKPRIASNFPTLNRFIDAYTSGLGETGMVWDRIVSREKVNYRNHVYDFTVDDKHHNFIANSFVVSNCGVRLLTCDLDENTLRPKLPELMDKLFRNVPSGVGSKSKLRISESELDDVSVNGARWAVEKGYATEEDLQHMEENGCIKGADPRNVGSRAKKRGRPQLGTLGAGNHFLEVQRVDKIFDKDIAEKFGIREEGQITVMIHCGSRGFGHQIASDYIGVMLGAAAKYGIKLPDKELACSPLNSREAKQYFSAMYCAVNYAFCNRQVITHWVRETFNDVFREDVELPLTYDVCHNIAKFEEHKVDGRRKKLCVHRKGATRAFPAGRKEIPEVYREVGHPVIIPGDMGTASYVLIGTERAMEETWGSACHGAGRMMSRRGALRRFRGEDIKKKLEDRGEVIRATHPKILAEEASEAYKDIDEVIRSVELSGIAKPIARVTPLGVAKG